MRNQLMTLTGTLRAFDGYDRWEKTPIQKFGTLSELHILKEEMEAPTFLKRKYIDLQIREATEEETVTYRNQLEKELLNQQEEQKKLFAQLQDVTVSIEQRRQKIQQLEQIKIPN